MVIYCRQEQCNFLRSLCQVPDVFVRFLPNIVLLTGFQDSLQY